MTMILMCVMTGQFKTNYMVELKICTFNMRGFSSSVPYMRKLLDNNDIILVSEHWLHSNKLDRLKEISSDISFCAKSSKYAAADNYGTRRGQGGVAIVWHDNLKGISEVKNIIYDRVCAVRLQTYSGAVIIIYSIYLPSRGNPEDYATAIDDLIEIIDSREDGSYCLIGGDINGDLGSLFGTRNTRKANDRGILFSEIINRYNLIVCNLESLADGPVDTFYGPTGSSMIDFICIPITMKDSLTACNVSDNEPLNNSDHESVSIRLNVKTLQRHTRKDSTPKNKRWDKLTDVQIFEKYSYPVECLLLQYIEPELTKPGDKDIDQIIQNIVQILSDCSNNIPVNKFRSNRKPYWNKKLTALKQLKINKFRAWVGEGRPMDTSSVSHKEHKEARKAFSKELRRLSRAYENELVSEAVSYAQIDRNAFWRIVKKSRSNAGGCINAIRNKEKIVVHEIDDILKTFKKHFESVCTPVDDSSYDSEHYDRVNACVNEYNTLNDNDDFLAVPFTEGEVYTAVKKLHLKKACGFDNISTEHIKYAGPCLIYILTLVYNYIRESEYIPINFRRGLQVPLYKGKNTCTLDMNNYRGITLLTNFNKIFEILAWLRIEKWWNDSGIISSLQGACRKGQSCVHTSYILQETVSTALDENNYAFSAYFDVSKAFDTVWINGLFYKMYDMGIRGKLWRLLYRCYVNFMCRVKIKDRYSNWFNMQCGIHQGGFLSLIKYIAFINQLITELSDSGYCCKIGALKSTPPGYADDIATVCLTKLKMDKSLQIVENYGKKWRFKFNAKKSAIMVYGENEKTNLLNSNHRVFKLGESRVKETKSYDHVGIKSCLYENNDRVNEKIVKARRAFNACSGIGIRKNGLTMKSCNIIFWGIIIPILTFGSEVWCLSDSDYENLCSFQRQIGRRIQRFPSRSPNSSSFFGLGWVRVTTYILVKKLLFAMSILRLDQNNVVRKIFVMKSLIYNDNRLNCQVNQNHSPTYDILNHIAKAGLYNTFIDIVMCAKPLVSKAAWSRIAWSKAWEMEDLFWQSTMVLNRKNDMLMRVSTETRYLTWWELSDSFPWAIKICENISRLVCRASKLKSDDLRLKGLLPSHKTCTYCDQYITENLFHVVMQCPIYEADRDLMIRSIMDLDPIIKRSFEEKPHEVFNWLIGKDIPAVDRKVLYNMWLISGKSIDKRYSLICKDREGVG